MPDASLIVKAEVDSSESKLAQIWFVELLMFVLKP